MKNVIKQLKSKIERELCQQTECPMTREYLEVNKLLEKNWLYLDDIWKRLDSYKPEACGCEQQYKRLSDAEIRDWLDHLKNEDNTTGAHWSMEETTAVAKANCVAFEHITPAEWNVAMNMKYSDDYAVAEKYGVNTANYYADAAKAFLFDRDGPKPALKLKLYYDYIVKA